MRYLHSVGQSVTTVEDGPRIELPDGHARIEVAYVGVCHTDLAAVAERDGTAPVRMGHEVSGIVTESRIRAVSIGARVAAHVGDGYASEIIAPESQIVPLLPDCTLLDGALAEPLACVFGGLEMVSFRDSSPIVLVGAGFMGLMALRYLTVLGHRVHVIEPREVARGLARAWGADRVFTPEESSEIGTATAPVVLEATGAGGGLELAGDLVKVDGTLGVLGYHQSNGGRRTLDMESWNIKALRVINMHNSSIANILRWMDRAQRSSALGFIRPADLVDSYLTLEELPQAFSGHGNSNAIKTVMVGPAARHDRA